MPYEMKDNSGNLFRNNEKSSDRSPDYSGSCLVNGVELKIGAWLKTSKKGEKFFSMSFRVPQGRTPQANGYQKPMPRQPTQEMNSNDWMSGDEAPF